MKRQAFIIGIIACVAFGAAILFGESDRQTSQALVASTQCQYGQERCRRDAVCINPQTGCTTAEVAESCIGGIWKTLTTCTSTQHCEVNNGVARCVRNAVGGDDDDDLGDDNNAGDDDSGGDVNVSIPGSREDCSLANTQRCCTRSENGRTFAGIQQCHRTADGLKWNICVVCRQAGSGIKYTCSERDTSNGGTVAYCVRVDEPPPPSPDPDEIVCIENDRKVKAPRCEVYRGGRVISGLDDDCGQTTDGRATIKRARCNEDQRCEYVVEETCARGEICWMLNGSLLHCMEDPTVEGGGDDDDDGGGDGDSDGDDDDSGGGDDDGGGDGDGDGDGGGDGGGYIGDDDGGGGDGRIVNECSCSNVFSCPVGKACFKFNQIPPSTGTRCLSPGDYYGPWEQCTDFVDEKGGSCHSSRFTCDGNISNPPCNSKAPSVDCAASGRKCNPDTGLCETDINSDAYKKCVAQGNGNSNPACIPCLRDLCMDRTPDEAWNFCAKYQCREDGGGSGDCSICNSPNVLCPGNEYCFVKGDLWECFLSGQGHQGWKECGPPGGGSSGGSGSSDSDDDDSRLSFLRAARDSAKETKAQAYEDYTSAKDDAWEGYQSAKADARSTYDDQLADARSTYDSDKTTAQETYNTDARAEARSEYDQAKLEARADYDEAKASALSAYNTVRENYNDAREASSEALETYKQDRTEENYNAYLEAKADLESAKEERTEAYEEYTEAKAEAQSAFAQARDDARAAYTAQRTEAREVYEEAREEIKNTYDQSRTDARSLYDQTASEARSEYEDIKTQYFDAYLQAKVAYEAAKKAYDDARN